MVSLVKEVEEPILKDAKADNKRTASYVWPE